MLLLIKLKPVLRASGIAITTSFVATLVSICGMSVSCGAQAQAGADGTAMFVQGQGDPQAQLQAARDLVRANPADAKAHYALAELLRKAGRHHEAADEYVATVEQEPTLYVAYHQLSTVNADDAQIDQAVAMLNRLKEDKPKEMMLRVALSELLEKRGKYYEGARVLVDLVYQNAVPDKYLPKVNSRIHYLLAKSRDSKETDKAAGFAEEELDTLPPPLPEATLHKELSTSRLKESRVMRGVGHAPLLP